ncbi:hypothetical protein [Methylocystis iwaonis]|nr:hypothetical protein [Methylocystis iwaonis]
MSGDFQGLSTILTPEAEREKSILAASSGRVLPASLTADVQETV